MGFFDKFSDLAKSAGDMAKTAGDKTRQQLEIAKLNMDISAQEDIIKGKKQQIGDLILREGIPGDNNPEVRQAVIALIGEIREVMAAIDEMKGKIAAIKAVPTYTAEPAAPAAEAPAEEAPAVEVAVEVTVGETPDEEAPAAEAPAEEAPAAEPELI